MTLVGSGFDIAPFSRKLIRVGDKQADIDHWSDTQVILILPPLTNGDHVVKVYIAGRGYAVSRYDSAKTVLTQFYVKYLWNVDIIIKPGILLIRSTILLLL